MSVKNNGSIKEKVPRKNGKTYGIFSPVRQAHTLQQMDYQALPLMHQTSPPEAQIDLEIKSLDLSALLLHHDDYLVQRSYQPNASALCIGIEWRKVTHH